MADLSFVKDFREQMAKISTGARSNLDQNPTMHYHLSWTTECGYSTTADS